MAGLSGYKKGMARSTQIQGLEDITKASKESRKSEQEDNRTTGQETNRSSEQLPKQLPKRSPKQESDRSTDQEDNKTSEQQNERTNEQVSNRTSEQESNRAGEQEPPLDLQKKPSDLKEMQYKILYVIYHNRPFKVSGKNRIGLMTKPVISYSNTRNCIKSLKNKGYIHKPFSINDGVNQGSTCQVVESKCFPLFGPTKIKNSEQVSKRANEQQDKRTNEQVSNRTNGQENNRAGEQELSLIEEEDLYSNIHSSSSFSENRPPLKFLIDFGLTEKKFNGLCKNLNLEPGFLEKQLEYAIFDLRNNQGIEKRKIESPLAYITKVLEKEGGVYPKPGNFKSHRQQQLDFLKEERKKEEDLLEKIKQEKIKRKQLEIKIWFEQLSEDEQKLILGTAKGERARQVKIETAYKRREFK